MITINGILQNNVYVPSTPPPGFGFGSYCDGTDFFYFESEAERTSFFSSLPVDLAVLKKQKIDVIDSKAEENIFNGFVFDGKTFSLSSSAQTNWLGLYTVPESSFPLPLSTKDSDVYILQYANKYNFYFTALNSKNAPLKAANVLKTAVKLATTVAELDAIIV